MTTEKVDLTVIGIFSLVGLPYTFKYLWSPLDGPVRPSLPRASPRVDAGDPGGPLPRHRRDGVLRACGASRRAGAPVVPRRLLQREPGHRGRRLAHRGPRPGGAGTGSGRAHPRIPRGDAHLGRGRPDPRRPDAVARRLSPDGRLPRRRDDRLLSRPGTGTGREEAENAEGGGRRAVPGVFRAARRDRDPAVHRLLQARRGDGDRADDPLPPRARVHDDRHRGRDEGIGDDRDDRGDPRGRGRRRADRDEGAPCGSSGSSSRCPPSRSSRWPAWGTTTR